MKCVIYYSSEGLLRGERPMLPERIEHYMSCLGRDLNQFPELHEFDLIVSTRLDGGQSEAEISSASKTTDAEVLSRLADALRILNMRTDGLSFLIREVRHRQH
jgi:hypothetical protein